MSEKDFESDVRRLFKNAFVDNCLIEGSVVSQEELDTIEELSIKEVIFNLSELLKALVLFKKEYIFSEKAELVKKSEQFESMLQKIEADVRSHIRVEHQLKLHIESNQSLNCELEALNTKCLSEICELKEKLKSYLKTEKKDKENLEKIDRLEEAVKKKDLLIGKLEKDILALRNLGAGHGDDKNNRKIRFLTEGNDEMKHKFEEKALGIQKLQNFLKDNMRSIKEKSKVTRKSIHENECAKGKIVEAKNTKNRRKSHSRSTSDNPRPRSVGKFINN